MVAYNLFTEKHISLTKKINIKVLKVKQLDKRLQMTLNRSLRSHSDRVLFCVYFLTKYCVSR